MKKFFLSIALASLCCGAMAQSLSDASAQLKMFGQVYKLLDMYYVDTLNAKKSVGTAVRSMLADLDPYTEYFDAKEAKDFSSAVTGKYAGVGAIIQFYKPEGRCIINKPYKGKPADKAGLRKGDVIISINGKDFHTNDTKNISDFTSSVSSALRGDAGTTITVKIKRRGVEQPFEVKVTRENVQLPSVPYSGMLDDQTGYVCLTSFTKDCSREVRDAIASLKQKGATRLVFDLRDNGGGLADEAVEIVNLFVPKGKLILSMKAKHKELNSSYATKNTPAFPDMPVVVLVNGNSASASEITCGALQDLDRAVVMGKRTYGKGLVQRTFDLPDNGLVKLTTSHYYIPSGRCIQALDYSQRSGQGEAYRTPDSLTKVFYTEAGRTVRDGGGITPDIDVDPDTLPVYIYEMLLDNEVGTFVTDYSAQHETIAPASKFRISDSDYDAFVERLFASQDRDIEPGSTKLLNQLERTMRLENMPADAYSKIKELRELFKPKKAEFLQTFRKPIMRWLEAEICMNYYGDAGALEARSLVDSEVKAALKLLNDPDRYKAILAPPAKTTQRIK